MTAFGGDQIKAGKKRDTGVLPSTAKNFIESLGGWLKMMLPYWKILRSVRGLQNHHGLEKNPEA